MNNNNQPSSKGKCNCGRYMSIHEDIAGVNPIGYECPDCRHRRYSKPLTSKEYYSKFKLVFN